MSEQFFSTTPAEPGDEILRQKFYESVAEQDKLISKVSGQVLTVELAIPGLYATALQLIRGETASIELNPAFYITYACWLLALGLTLAALIPKYWQVNPEVIAQDAGKKTKVLGLVEFFQRTAAHKRRLLIGSCILFFLGILSAGFTI
jgi:hypothetical protein